MLSLSNFFQPFRKYRINDLLEIIQASEEEIYNYLNYIEAFQINGKNNNK